MSESHSSSNQNHAEISTVVTIEHDLEKCAISDNTRNTIDWVKEEYDQPLTNYCLTEETGVKKEFGNSDGMVYSLHHGI